MANKNGSKADMKFKKVSKDAHKCLKCILNNLT